MSQLGDCCTAANARLVIRATEREDVWGTAQVFECRSCGRRWSE